MEKTVMYAELTGRERIVNIQARTIIGVSVNDAYFKKADLFIGKNVYPKDISKWCDGTYGFGCVIDGERVYFHSVMLDKHIE